MIPDISKLRIALDGPGGSGKSSVAKAIAAKTGMIYVDTGAMYRTVGLYMQNEGISDTDGTGIVSALGKVEIALSYEDGRQVIRLGGCDVGDKIRTERSSLYASAVAKLPEVREKVNGIIKELTSRGGVIMDGRDIGTVVMPDAEVKVFLTATSETRAMRRWKELTEKGQDVKYEDVLSSIIARDRQDSERDAAPLVPAEDALVLYNDELNMDETVGFVLGYAAAVSRQ